VCAVPREQLARRVGTRDVDEEAGQRGNYLVDGLALLHREALVVHAEQMSHQRHHLRDQGAVLLAHLAGAPDGAVRRQRVPLLLRRLLEVEDLSQHNQCGLALEQGLDLEVVDPSARRAHERGGAVFEGGTPRWRSALADDHHELVLQLVVECQGRGHPGRQARLRDDIRRRHGRQREFQIGSAEGQDLPEQLRVQPSAGDVVPVADSGGEVLQVVGQLMAEACPDAKLGRGLPVAAAAAQAGDAAREVLRSSRTERLELRNQRPPAVGTHPERLQLVRPRRG
jgi:hypothetical protein